MTIKARILIPLIIVAVLVASTVLVSNIIQFSKYVDTKLNDDLDRALIEMQNEIELLEGKAAHIASLYFSSDSVIVSALAESNREILLNRALFLAAETEVDFCVITDSSGIVLARSHAPEIYGDDSTSMHSVRSAISGVPLTMTECDCTMDMGACSGSPIYDEQHRLLGAVVVGFRLDTDEFVDKQKKIANCEITIFRGDVRVATTLLDKDGVRAVGTKAPNHISKAVLEGKSYSGYASMLDDNALAKHIPIMDPEDKVIGMLFVGHSLKEKTDTIKSFVRAGLLSTLVLLLASIIFILIITVRLTEPITKMLDKIHHDPLTGIYNRRYFDENLDRLIKSISRSSGTLSLMMIDVDYFKNYNDNYGHSKGDECLKTVARTLASGITRVDDFVVRYGGEEFAVVMPNTDENGARNVAEELLRNIQALNIPHEKSKIADHVTISIGVTTSSVNYTQNGIDYVNRADEMLYKSKLEGRNRYNFASL